MQANYLSTHSSALDEETQTVRISRKNIKILREILNPSSSHALGFGHVGHGCGNAWNVPLSDGDFYQTFFGKVSTPQ